MTDPTPPAEAKAVRDLAAAYAQMTAQIGKVIVGQHELIRRLLTGLFAAIPFATSRGRARAGCGHILLEGVPGVAKTLTATTLAHAISARFQRIHQTQCATTHNDLSPEKLNQRPATNSAA